VIALATLLVVPLMLGEFLWFPDIYWRVTVAVAILAAVGTALIPLVNALFAPKKPRAVAASPAPYGVAPAPVAPVAPAALAAPAAPEPQELLPWPTYVDGTTPLPMLPDGSPDWGAYYTGYPTPGAHVFSPAQPATPAQSATSVPPDASPAPPDVSKTDAAAPAPSGYEGFPPPPPLPPRP
jgi:hypothetical protein